MAHTASIDLCLAEAVAGAIFEDSDFSTLELAFSACVEDVFAAFSSAVKLCRFASCTADTHTTFVDLCTWERETKVLICTYSVIIEKI